jgi:hypothetical protein
VLAKVLRETALGEKEDECWNWQDHLEQGWPAQTESGSHRKPLL